MNRDHKNPFGTDAETLRYAAEQVKLPVLATQLRRIADRLDPAFPRGYSEAVYGDKRLDRRTK